MPCLSRLTVLVVLFGLPYSSNLLADDSAHQPNGKYIQRWNVVGPFVLHDKVMAVDKELLKTKFDEDFLVDAGGEREIVPSPSLTHEALGPWKEATATESKVDLAAVLGEKEWSVGYAATGIHSEQARTTVLSIGSDDAVKVWLNGELVHENWVGRAWERDQDVISVNLRKGYNRLLLKVMNWEADWSFSCRFLDNPSQAQLLVSAAGQRDETRIKDLLAAGVDVNSVDDLGMTPYLVAKIKGNEKIARMLEVLGADTEIDFDSSRFLDRYLKSKATRQRPGVAVLIAKGDEILYSRGFGDASIEHDVAVTPETKFRIGSVSKQFTAAAILKLQEDGKLNVTDTLSHYFPDFPRGDQVTLHHLLTHTSGLKSFTSRPDFFKTVASRVEPTEMLESFQEDGFDFDPGEKFAYCNTGYFLLGQIVEQVSGQSFDDYLKTAFFDPLGMSNTGVHDSRKVYKHEATGYSIENGEVAKALDWDMSHAGGAGNLYSTVTDLHRWNQGIFGGDVLSPETLKSAHTVNEVEAETLEMPYGYGWMIDQHRGLDRISHSGGLQGFVSQLSYYPEFEVTVAALHNASPSVPELAPGTLAEIIAQSFLWPDMKARPKYELAEDVDTSTYDDYLGQYDYLSGILTVTHRDGKLMAQISGQSRYEIFPAGDDKFFWKVVDAQVEFLRDSSGQVTSARHTQGIARFVASRVKPRTAIELPAAILDRYVGNYNYSGLGDLTIRRDDHRLFAQMQGQPEFEIYAESETDFFWRVVNAQLKFSVDEDGQVIEATHLQAGRELTVKKSK